MKNLSSILQREFSEAIQRTYSDAMELSGHLPAEVVQSTQEQFGHYQCNSALRIGKELKRNPQAVAKEIISNLDADLVKIVESMEVAGPGFINIKIAPSFLAQEIKDALEDPKLGVEMPIKKEKVIVEFSSPNIAKELHVGHLRSTIIGDSLARLFEFYDFEVLRLNHVGDWGTQFGMLIRYLKENHPAALEKEEKTDLSSLMQWYKEAKQAFDNDPAFKKRSQQEVVELQGGNEESIKAWEKICEISRKAYQEIYDLLDVKLIERGESFYSEQLPDIVNDLENKGLIEISEGAKCLFFEEFKNKEGQTLPMIVQKSDGGYNYSTTDLAAMRHRIQEEKADRIIIVTDSGQSLHFQMIKRACIAAGYLDPDKIRFDHVVFGVVLSPEGKKFKTREGETKKLIDLIYRAIDQAKVLLKERSPGLSEEELQHMAEVLGIDAIKYADLSCHRQKDYVFSYDRMLRFEGNTASYLLYSYVRIQGIKRRTNKNIDNLIKTSDVQLAHPTEISLALSLRQFGEALEAMDRDLLPNRLADYLYHLAEKFHAFFRDCRVEGSDLEDSRLLLCEFTGRILKLGLNLLGLKTLEKM
ncbi:MAG: arginine--tRNA ligase [Simkaniaceae bacterium]